VTAAGLLASGAVPVGGLSSTSQLGLGLVGAVFILFALVSAFLLPRARPNFPGRGLRWFVLLCLLFFAAMISAVVVFGKEEEAEAEAGEGETQTDTLREPVETSAGTAVKKVKVSLVDFKVRLPAGTRLSPGKYEFDVENDGKVPHNLVVAGPSNPKAQTPVFGPGKEAELSAALTPGSYEFYCSVPGHKEAGMTVDVEVAS
jgi:uncharacterized cupredoxin-like copper-binding protein